MHASSVDRRFAGSIPQMYEQYLVPLIFEPYAAELAERLQGRHLDQVLEVAAGTGVVTRRLAHCIPAACELVATDLNQPMLEQAAAMGVPRQVRWQQADAMALPFADASFDAVVCQFGVMFFPDKAQAFAQARRVLRPGGVLLFNVWDRIEENPHALANAQAVESRFPGDADMKFRTPYELHDPALLHSLLAQAGFADITMETRRMAIDGADPRKIAAGQIRGTPRAALLVQRGVPLDAVIEDVAAALTRQGGDPYHGHAQALVVRAR